MIKVENLSKRYGKKLAVANLSFEVPDGQVTGFLGPNGSGKSTTMRAILGLDKPSSGKVTFSGTNSYGDYNGDFATLKGKTQIAGAILDATWFHPGRSGLSHLSAIAYGAGISKTRVAECVELVGMTDAIKQRAGRYSLGMKQRLMLAAALLGDPQHLILDEPVNGLDPEGVSWMRKIIRYFAAEGKAVLVSSHLLGEMQQTADNLVVIGKGKLIGAYTMQEFLAGGTKIIAEVKNPQALTAALIARGFAPHSTELTTGFNQLTLTLPEGTNEAEIRHLLATAALETGTLVTKLTTEQENLEERFLAATANAQEYKTASTAPQSR